MKQINHDPNEQPKGSPDMATIIGYIVAAALLLPLGWWLKANYAADLGSWTLSWFH